MDNVYDDGPGAGPYGSSTPDSTPDSMPDSMPDSAPDSTNVSWGPARWVGVLTAIAAPAALVWLLLDSNPENRIVAGALVVACTLTATALARMKSRLRATDEGIVVTGPLHTRKIGWAQLESIATPERGRFGRRGASLELEVRPPEPPAAYGGETSYGGGNELDSAALRDTELFAFGAFDLGSDPAQVGRTLFRLHRRYTP